MRGKISEISIPETLVLIGLKGPRMDAGASGFMSHVSSWLGPPTNISWIQFTSLLGCHRTHRLEAEEVGHGQPQEAERPSVEKIPPTNAVTEMGSLISVKSKHCSLSQSGQSEESPMLPPQELPNARWRYVQYYTLWPQSLGSWRWQTGNCP